MGDGEVLFTVRQMRVCVLLFLVIVVRAGGTSTPDGKARLPSTEDARSVYEAALRPASVFVDSLIEGAAAANPDSAFARLGEDGPFVTTRAEVRRLLLDVVTARDLERTAILRRTNAAFASASEVERLAD